MELGAIRLRLVELAFVGVDEPQPWQSLAQALRAELSANYVGIVLRYSGPDAEDGFVTGDAAWTTEEWVAKYHSKKYFPIFPPDRLSPGRVYSVEEFFLDKKWRDSDFYLNCYKHCEMDNIICLNIGSANGYTAHLYIGRSDIKGPFEQRECELCEFIVPFMYDSLRLYSGIMQSAARKDVAEDVLASIGVGSMLMDSRGNIFDADTLAREIARRSKAVSITNGKLAIADPTSAERLRAACSDLLSSGSPAATRAFFCGGKGGEGAVHILLRLMDKDYGQEVKRYFRLLISDADQERHMPNKDVVAELYGLTEREAACTVLLVMGLSIDQVADRLGITPGTARTHLKRIFSKVGVCRQAELVTVISRSLAIFSAGTAKIPEPA